jgi:hypothetical protein
MKVIQFDLMLAVRDVEGIDLDQEKLIILESDARHPRESGGLLDTTVKDNGATKEIPAIAGMTCSSRG